MPVIKSAIKRAKQEKKRKAYNVSVKSSVKLKFKAVRDELATGKVKSNEDLIAASDYHFPMDDSVLLPGPFKRPSFKGFAR